MDLLEVRNISFQEQNHTVLQDISFNQQEGQKIVIAGETGSGKSTLLQIVAGLIQPTGGQVYFNGKRVRGPQEVLVPGEPGIAYLSQHFELPQFLRVAQVLKYANTLPDGEDEALFKLCRIEHLLQRKTSELSGGERQRIALAKLLLTAPDLLLLDEPFSNLDTGHKKILKNVIRDIADQLAITCLLVSHDPLDTLSWADEILVLQAGQLVQQGSPEQVYRQPINSYAAGLFGNFNLIPADQTNAFLSAAKIKATGKHLLIRPEHLQLVKKGPNAVPGRVRAVCYFGSYYETEIALAETIIVLKTVAKPAEKGEVVYLWVAPENIWFID